MTDLAQRRETMLKRLDELNAKLQAIEEELESHHSRDWEDAAIEHEGDEVLEDLGNADKQEIRMIKAALARMDAGEYGYCATCGDKISEDRLDVLPYTPFCRKCAP